MPISRITNHIKKLTKKSRFARLGVIVWLAGISLYLIWLAYLILEFFGTGGTFQEFRNTITEQMPIHQYIALIAAFFSLIFILWSALIWFTIWAVTWILEPKTPS